MIGIDTFSWSKLLYFRDTGEKDLIIEILKHGNFFITYEVQEELLHRYPNEEDFFRYAAVLPSLGTAYHHYSSLGFDEADISLLEYGEKKDFQIITEDHKMLEEAVTDRNNLIQLGDYFGALYQKGYLTSKELYQFARKLRQMKNITKRKEKELLDLRRK